MRVMAPLVRAPPGRRGGPLALPNRIRDDAEAGHTAGARINRLPTRFRTPARCTVARTTTAEGDLRTRFVDLQAASAELKLVQLADGLFRFGVRTHFDKSKSAPASGRGVAHDRHSLDVAGAREQLLEFRFPRFIGKVADI